MKAGDTAIGQRVLIVCGCAADRTAGPTGTHEPMFFLVNRVCDAHEVAVSPYVILHHNDEVSEME